LSSPPRNAAGPTPEVFARACQAIVEQDFLHRCAVQFGCDYAEVERVFDCLTPNVCHLVNSPGGRVLLARTLSGDTGHALTPSMH
jgi:hypothetical protein